MPLSLHEKTTRASEEKARNKAKTMRIQLLATWKAKWRLVSVEGNI